MTKQRKLAECVFHKGFVTEQVDPVVDRVWKASFGGKTPFGDLRNMWRRHHCRTLNPYGDSENCPYDEKQCARAFFDAVKDVTVAHRVRSIERPVGYFIRIAKSTAARRADEAVASRARSARLRGTDVPFGATDAAAAYRHAAQATEEPRPDPRGLGSPVRTGDRARPADRDRRDHEAGPEGVVDPSPGPHRGVDHGDQDSRLPGSDHRPTAVGDLFRSLALGPRPRPEPADEGEEGAR